jgi:hypothetical protein
MFKGVALRFMARLTYFFEAVKKYAILDEKNKF